MSRNTPADTQELFCANWVGKHFEQQPAGSPALSYFVSGWACFRDYIKAADTAGYQPFTIDKFFQEIKSQFPRVKRQQLNQTVIYTGVRYYEDHIGGKMVFGV